ncbi:MAG: SagB/ThcOx family dehydrogenase [Deltaproteobacteria bacterium]|nr:SagB/ThcOx family dehydrogenase [Deltaproteobacteria bacterium]
MRLPRPKIDGQISLERSILERRTVRAFGSRPLTLEQLGQLLWAAQGLTGSLGMKRAAPSAGALYPMNVYAVAGDVRGLDAGVYLYAPGGHKLGSGVDGDLRKAVARASLSQAWVAEAPVILIVTAEYERITGKYGRRGVQYAMIESGHIGQNIFLQAVALGLGAGIVGAFREDDLGKALGLPGKRVPLLVMPVGYKR